ncbi:MAG: DNA/RNA nuclease SfsA [Pseudomonadota bacterium]
MQFARPLIRATLLKRYKRFLADARLEEGPRAGEEVTAHLANPGSMMSLKEPGLEIWLEENDDPKRKLKFTWRLLRLHRQGPEAAQLGDRAEAWVGIDTGVPNRIAGEALRDGRIPGLEGYETVRPEVRYGTNSRVDFLLEGPDRPSAYVEVKNVHLVRQPGLAEFPDSVTTRGAKHLAELAAMVEAGHRAVMLYVIQRDDCSRLAFAADLDPGYARAYVTARERGVEAMAITARVSPGGIVLDRPVPIAD